MNRPSRALLAVGALIVGLAGVGLGVVAPASAASVRQSASGAAPKPSTAHRPIDVVVVIDTSVRADPFQFRATKLAAAKVIEAIPIAARVGLITSGTFPTVLRQMSRGNRSKMSCLILTKKSKAVPPAVWSKMAQK